MNREFRGTARPANAQPEGEIFDDNEKAEREFGFSVLLAEWTGLEPATPGVTGRYSNQLNYHSLPALKLIQAMMHELLLQVFAA